MAKTIQDVITSFLLHMQNSKPESGRGVVQEDVKEAVAALTAQFSHPVLELIKRRLREGSKPGRRQDTALLALVVEGGGMRGAVSAGGLQALHDLEMRCVVYFFFFFGGGV